MAGRISRGWSLMKQSWAVLSLDKELMLFPILSSISCFLVLASFVLPFALVPNLRDYVVHFVHAKQEAESGAAAQDTRWEMYIPAIVVFCFYLVNYFVIVFFNTALVSCAVKRFTGGDPTVGYGLSAAFSRLPQILMWSLVAATIGFILQAIEDRLKFVGRIIVGLIGVAWTIVTYLVVPVLAVERVGPIRAVKRSAELLSKTWGEAIVGNISLGIVGFLITLPGILLLIAAPLTGTATHSIWLAAVPAVLGVIYLIGCTIVTSTLKQIMLAGVYLYAAQGQVPEGFSEDAMRSAFRPKGE